MDIKNRKWWHNAIGYQIYPKSFQDTNGDGIGDLPGVVQHLDYLQELGINVLWICPVYKSPMMDHGYDISDYDEIDPMFGDREDIIRLIEEAEKRGIKILMDLVVNHTSDEHPWFREALKDPAGKYGKYYIIRQGTADTPPNNWRSIFGGSAWEKIGDSDLYYLHLFTKGQPDLNWENEELREDIYAMVNRWLDLGIGGFRVDAISHIKKDFSYQNKEADGADGLVWAGEYFRNVKGLEVFLAELRNRTFKLHDSFTVGEIDDIRDEDVPEYIGDDGYFSTVFDFCHTHYWIREDEWKNNPVAMVEELKKKLFDKQEFAKEHGFLCNFLENHDQPRALDRFIPPEHIHFHSASMLGVINFFFRGIPFLYQGQEIGMRDFPKQSIAEYKDPATYTRYESLVNEGMTEAEVLHIINMQSREHSRTPMQWNDGKNAGFTEGEPWFEVNPDYQQVNFEQQKKDPDSLLHFYKKMIAVRKRNDFEELFVYGEMIPFMQEEMGIIAYKRIWEGREVLVVNNCSSQKKNLTFTSEIKECLLNNYKEIERTERQLVLWPFQSIVCEIV